MVQSKYFHFCDDQKNRTFILYNVEEKKMVRLNVPYVTLLSFDSIQLNNIIYFTGGGMPASKTRNMRFFKTAIRVTLMPEIQDIVKLEKLSNMCVSRSKHTLAMVNNKIFAIGGFNEADESNTCEAFSADENQWHMCSSLNERKACVSVCSFLEKYLYAFGGVVNSKSKETSLIECLDITIKSAGQWRIIELIEGKEIWKEFVSIGAIELDENNILLFGGISNGMKQDSTFYFNPIDKRIAKGAKLERGEAFYRAKPGKIRTEINVASRDAEYIHIYNFSNTTWKLVWEQCNASIAS